VLHYHAAGPGLGAACSANEGGVMFGTIGHARFKPENREALERVLQSQALAGVAGFRHGFVLYPDVKDEVYIIAVFEDRDAYYANANDPAQHERYLEYRALLEDDPTWIDGEIGGSD
jgi:heme-degrading monooxygenase HmoA